MKPDSSGANRPLFQSTSLLILFGIALLFGHAAYSWASPLRDHIPLFLLIYSLLFFLLFFLIFLLKRQPGTILFSSGRTNAAVIFFFACGVRFLILGIEPTLSDDIYRYIWDGRVQNAGINPYLYPPSSDNLAFLRDPQHALINHPSLRTIYPPLAEAFFRFVTNVSSTVLGMKLFLVAVDVIVILLLFQLLRAQNQPSAWAVIYAWNPLVIMEIAGSGHVDVLMICFWMGALLLFMRGRSAGGAGLTAGATLSKLIPIIMVPWMMLSKGRRFLILAGMVLLAGVLPYWSGLEELMLHGPSESNGVHAFARDWMFNPGLYDWIRGFFPSPFHTKLFLGFCLIVFAFLWAKRNRRRPLLYAFGAVYALLLCSPVVHPWYVTWLVPFLCVYPLWSGLYWSWAVGFSYIVLMRYGIDGVWRLPPMVPVVEYGLLYALLFWELSRGFKQKGAGRVIKANSNSFLENKLNVTVIIPALNEEKALPIVLHDLPLGLVRDVIVVDNGSTDQTALVAAAAGARVVSEPRRGYGRAVQTGLAQLKPNCDTVVILDGDHSDFPEDLSLLLSPIETGEADMVIGTRTRAAEPGSLTPQQRFGNWLTCALLRLLFGEIFTDMGPFRAIRRDALERLKLTDMNYGWNVEMQVKALQAGLTIAEAPVRYRPRIGTSKISGTIKGSVKAGVIILWSLYKYGWNEKEDVSGSLRT